MYRFLTSCEHPASEHLGHFSLMLVFPRSGFALIYYFCAKFLVFSKLSFLFIRYIQCWIYGPFLILRSIQSCHFALCRWNNFIFLGLIYDNNDNQNTVVALLIHRTVSANAHSFIEDQINNNLSLTTFFSFSVTKFRLSCNCFKIIKDKLAYFFSALVPLANFHSSFNAFF